MKWINFHTERCPPAFIMITAFLSAVFLFTAQTTHGQLTFTSNQTKLIDFSTTISGVNNGIFEGTGFAPSPGAGQLDSDAFSTSGFSADNVAFGQTATSGDAARGTTSGGVSIGGIYGLTPDPALYIQPGESDFTPGSITLRIKNMGPTSIQQITVSYDVLILNDQNRSNTFNFSHSADDIDYTVVGTADYTSETAADQMPAVTRIGRGPIVIAGLNVSPGGFYYLRWTGDDAGGAGSRDEFGLDNISVAAQLVPTAARGRISGRVRDQRGRGLPLVAVMLTGGSLSEQLFTMTNSYGYYDFSDLPAGDTYVLQVFSKRYSFKQTSRVIRLEKNLTNADFIGRERPRN